ncbi:outer membrane protein assembly factor BamB family protein [Calditrichota bacterium GD2]
MMPTISESKKIIFQNAIDVATMLLEATSTHFKFAESKEESYKLLTFKCKKWAPLDRTEEVTPFAVNLLRVACVFQAVYFLNEKQIALNSKYLCELGDRFFYDEGQPDLALKSFQLAAGFDGTNEEAIWGVLTVCLQSSVPTRIALPYSIVLANLNPQKDEVGYVLERMEMENPLHVQTLLGEKVGLEEETCWFTGGGNEKRSPYISSQLSPPFKIKWVFEECASIFGGIAAANDVVVFGDAEGRLYGIDFHSGEKIWEKKLDGKHLGTPTIAHGKVVTGLSNKAICINLSTGKTLWQFEEKAAAPDDISNFSFASCGCPLSFYRYTVFCDDRLTIFETETGRRIFNRQLGFETAEHSGPCFEKIYFYLPQGRSFLRFSIVTQQIDDLPIFTNGKITSGPLIHDKKLLFGTGHSSVEAISLIMMKTLWSFTIENSSRTSLGYLTSRPAVYQENVVFGAPDGSVYNIDLNNGKKIWKTGLGHEIESPVLITNDRVIVLSGDGALHVLDLGEGKVLWEKQLANARDVASAPAIYKDHLLVGLDKLYCLEMG